ncbi:MAG: hypothetical protein K2X77_28715 [Candidatus Obscuribacterales bacterium]|jgi:hypothetical protein|nr:hypothetical protein [Candidatus Obscuribacterales bacterium]
MQVEKIFSFLATLCILSPLCVSSAQAQDFRASDQFSARYNSFSDSLSSLGFEMSKAYNQAQMKQARWQFMNSPPTELTDPMFAAAIKKSQQSNQQQQNQSNNATNAYGLPNFGLPNYGLGGSLFDNPFFSSQGSTQQRGQ